MSGRLVFFRNPFNPESKLSLTREEASHVKARRLSPGDQIEFRNGLGRSFQYEIQHETLAVRLLGQTEHALPPKREIAIALPKGQRLDFLIEKGTELGLTHIYFLLLERSIRKEFNQERAERLVREAASQSNQHHLLQFSLLSWKDLVQAKRDSLLVLHPQAEEFVKLSDWKGGMIPVVGPEGGWSKEEEALWRGEKIPERALPGGILRTETAGLAAASFLLLSG
ncbi:ribosomal RNA small subunit methyltransferase E [Leptospira ryugenii]|uniref:Ribosomal RNA small subunit methyltransferase E n=1 Tax=Leptospira ryugenii TaxID=1917863 RepID=A0A2P2DVM0_9LEPT|nr:RsmE family RNA methyltransferase [Leptospira ryugenii]GBF48691.1 ribosomal RNA small subunit methyltransferase E [Leptospira ryugenii]